VNVAGYQAKTYPDPPCWALVADVYATERGEPVTEYRTVTNTIRGIADAFRLALHKGQHGFSRIDAPVEFCVVLMGTRPDVGLHHAGVYYQDRVLHATEAGVLYQDMASLSDKYPLMEFWAR
jgi:hypothetical protein